MDVIQVGEAGLVGLHIVLIGHTGKAASAILRRQQSLWSVLTLNSALTLGIVNTLNCSPEAVYKAWSPYTSGTCTRSGDATQKAGSMRSRTSGTVKPPRLRSATVTPPCWLLPPCLPRSRHLHRHRIGKRGARVRATQSGLHIQGTCQEEEAAHSAREGVFSQQGSLRG